MKKIAIITNTDFKNRKGEANAALNRIKYLKQIAMYDIDVYNLAVYEGFLVRFLRKSKKVERIQSLQVEGIEIKYFWSKFSLINFILETKLGFKRIFEKNKYNKIIDKFSIYDTISAHSSESGKLAFLIKQKFNIPYYVTWHGSDIHTAPMNNKFVKQTTIKILENATNNFFVSNALMNTSCLLTTKHKRTLLYNGVNDIFVKYSDNERSEIKAKLKIENKKIVAFVGNLFSIKNVLLLPEIFKTITDNYDGNILFWIIGDGKLKNSLVELLSKNNITNYHLWGNQPVEKMPEFMNVIDVLILPSKNEGLPLVTVEALACGANVVGSNVGGISEAIGLDNVFDLNDDFINNISNRIIEMLRTNVEQPLSEKFSWSETAKIENAIYLEKLSI